MDHTAGKDTPKVFKKRKEEGRTVITEPTRRGCGDE